MIDKDQDPAPGQYWEFVGAEGDDDEGHSVKPGDLVLVAEIKDGHVWFASGRGSKTGWKEDEFLATFRPAPEGGERRRKEIAELLQSLEQMDGDSLDLREKLDALSPHLGADGKMLLDGSGGSPAEPQAALAVRPTKSAVTVKSKLNEFRIALKKHQAGIEAKRARIEALLEEQQEALEGRIAQMQEMIEYAEEAVATLNLYLGKGENIVRLAKGEPAPTDTKIVIRQLVLYMDEECAIASESGGIDARSIGEFDTWLKKPGHLEQVLPEIKGVVALKPRRNAKDYGTGNPSYEAKLNEGNFETYWLVRNGGNLYRIANNLHVGAVIVPKRGEFDEFFKKRKYNFGKHGYDESDIRPGDAEWMQAMKQVDAQRRHYMRVLLFLQGLIDRTHVLWPLPGERINIMKERVHTEHVRYIYDAQEDRLLPTGREAFRDWQREINGKIEAGHRIIGSFHQSGEHDDSVRVFPRGVDHPKPLALHTVESRTSAHLSFRYARSAEDRVWGHRDRYGNWIDSHPATRRAGCTVDVGHRGILNFDLADVESMRFYLQDRVNRHGYADMFPVLKTALAMKEKEAQEEAPFLLLLAGEIMKVHDASRAEAEAAVPELVRWWKFKNRTHRALTSEDAKAVRMIVAEYGRLRGRRRGIDHAPVVAKLLADRADVLFLSYKGDGRYIRLLPENMENIFVREEVWKDGRTLHLEESKPWRVIDSRFWLQTVLYESLRLKDWPRDLRRERYLANPEREEAVREILESSKDLRDSTWHKNAVKLERIAISLHAGVREPCLRLHAADVSCKPDQYHNSVEVRIYTYDYRWSWKKGSLHLSSPRSDSGYHNDSFPRWARNDKYHEGAPEPVLLWIDKAAVDRLQEAEKKAQAVTGKQERKRRIRDSVWHQAKSIVIEKFKEKERIDYVAEYGSDELFDSENKDRDWYNASPWPDTVGDAADAVLKKTIKVDGWTFSRLFEEARKLGWKPSKKSRDRGIDYGDAAIEIEKEEEEDEGENEEAEA